jgi:hypothetical protein
MSEHWVLLAEANAALHGDADEIAGPLSMLLVNCLRDSPELVCEMQTYRAADIVGQILRQLPGIRVTHP